MCMQVDFWKPASAELVTTNSTVDIRVPADWVAELQSELEKIALKFESVSDTFKHSPNTIIVHSPPYFMSEQYNALCSAGF